MFSNKVNVQRPKATISRRKILLVTLLLFLILSAFQVSTYDRLVTLRQTCNQSWSDIEVQLKQRRNLVPQIVNTVKGYANDENKIFENVVKARNAASSVSTVKGQAQAEGMLSQALGELFAFTEDYPELKANENFLQLQDQLADVENKIAASRRFYNNAAQEYNSDREKFPAVLMAGPAGFQVREFF